MAWTAPKTDWTEDNAVGDADINEIGENLVYLKTHADATSGVHGGTSAATPNTFMVRDAAGRAKVVAPSAETDIALKSNVTAEAAARVAAEAILSDAITANTAALVLKAGDTMTGRLIGYGADVAYTTAQFRNIKFMTSVPGVGDLENGEMAVVYEV